MIGTCLRHKERFPLINQTTLMETFESLHDLKTFVKLSMEFTGKPSEYTFRFMSPNPIYANEIRRVTGQQKKQTDQVNASRQKYWQIN